jgi:hypothetical protein
VKDAAGCVFSEGKINASRRDLDMWIRTLPEPRMIALEATIFTGWIYDHLLPHTELVFELEMLESLYESAFEFDQPREIRVEV